MSYKDTKLINQADISSIVENIATRVNPSKCIYVRLHGLSIQKTICTLRNRLRSLVLFWVSLAELVQQIICSLLAKEYKDLMKHTHTYLYATCFHT